MDGHSKSQVKRLVAQSPEYAAGYQAGREAGMREAAGVAEGERDLMTRLGKSHPADSSARDGCFARARSAEHMRYAILSAIGGGK